MNYQRHGHTPLAPLGKTTSIRRIPVHATFGTGRTFEFAGESFLVSIGCPAVIHEGYTKVGKCQVRTMLIRNDDSREAANAAIQFIATLPERVLINTANGDETQGAYYVQTMDWGPELRVLDTEVLSAWCRGRQCSLIEIDPENGQWADSQAEYLAREYEPKW